MDYGTLAREVVTFIGPFLPWLLHASGTAAGKAAEGAAKALGEDAYKKAKAIWAKLHPRLAANPAALAAAEEVAQAPEDQDAVAALRLQVKKLLASDETLLRDLTALRGDGLPTVNIGGSADGATIVTGSTIQGDGIAIGDHNTTTVIKGR